MSLPSSVSCTADRKDSHIVVLCHVCSFHYATVIYCTTKNDANSPSSSSCVVLEFPDHVENTWCCVVSTSQCVEQVVVSVPNCIHKLPFITIVREADSSVSLATKINNSYARGIETHIQILMHKDFNEMDPAIVTPIPVPAAAASKNENNVRISAAWEEARRVNVKKITRYSHFKTNR